MPNKPKTSQFDKEVEVNIVQCVDKLSETIDAMLLAMNLLPNKPKETDGK